MNAFQAMSLTAAVAAPLAFGTPALADLKGSIKVDGSSTVYPITAAVGEAFHEENTGVAVTVNFSGTGGGFKKFAAGQTDISDASRPIKAKEDAATREAGISYIEIPVAYDGLTIVINKANDWAKQLTVEQLQKIFLDDSVKSWKDVDAKFPDVAIKIFAPGEASGTFDYFKEVVVGKSDKQFRADMSKNEDDNVLVTGVAGDPGAIGFFGVAYYEENKDKLQAVAIQNDEGKYVAPTAETIEDGTYNPFSRPLFIYVSTASLDRPEVAAFIDFYFDAGPDLAEQVGYVRLPSAVYEAAKHNADNRKTGTQYLDAEGEKVTGPVTKVYKKIK